MAELTNREHKRGTLADALQGADVFFGVSAPNVLTPEMIKTMAADPIVFAMANPTPEIMPDAAKAAGARVVGTGRSDFPNQINNVMAFPGIFRGALDCRASCINEEMKVATSYALASLVREDELNEEYISSPTLWINESPRLWLKRLSRRPMKQASPEFKLIPISYKLKYRGPDGAHCLRPFPFVQ